MYKNCLDPWFQDSKEFPYKYLSPNLLKRLGYDFYNILDLGCGKEKFTNEIKKAFPKADVTGIDISPTAVSIARSKYRKISFETRDVNDESLNFRGFDCIFMTEIIWYILPYLSSLFKRIKTAISETNGILCINNHFYKDEEQKYGKRYITDVESLLKMLLFKVEYLLENNRFDNYDVTIICRL